MADGPRRHSASLDGSEPRAGHGYSNTSISGNARAHFGDTHDVHYHIHPSQEDKYEVLHRSLTFERMSARLLNVERALPSTCQWLFTHDQFVAWTDRTMTEYHHGLLWIKGKPGSGKSTMMKEALAWAEKEWSTQIIISYFFNGRAPGELEKSSLGLYRSLLHQLLSSIPAIRPLFLSRFSLKATKDKVEDWTEIELQNFFTDAITMTQTIFPPVNIFIDALDEGQEDDVRQMLGFLEHLGQDATASNVKFRICLSSRYYPNITIDKGLFIFMEKETEHSQDIEKYILAKLRGTHSSQTNMLRKEVSKKSAGVFLWVVLVVQMLNKMCDQGKQFGAMIKKLRSTPEKLHSLFATLINTDDEDIGECITLFQWVMFSLEPLSPIELYLAIHQTHAPSEVEEAHSVNQAIAVKYIMNCSRGLIELTEYSEWLGTNQTVVQFIHETVRDYLVEADVLSHQKLNPRISPTISLTEICDMVITENCLQYLLQFCATAMVIEEHDWEVRYPLVNYGKRFWWKHLRRSNGACSQGLLSLALTILMLGGAHLRNFILKDGIDPAARGPAPPIYYASMIGVHALVSIVLVHTADVNAEGGYYGNALQVASHKGHHEVVEMLILQGANINAQGGIYGNALQAASLGGHQEVLKMLIQQGANVNAQEGYYGNALQAASLGGHQEVVKMLIRLGAAVNAQGGNYGNALQAASLACHQEVVKMLIQQGANVNARGGEYDNALQAASLGGHQEVVKMLIRQGANVNAQGGYYGNALQAASSDGYQEVVKMLIRQGANVNAQGGYYGNALQAASLGGYQEVVEILIRQGANANAQGGQYGNALQAALVGGHQEVAEILIQHGANANAQGGRYGNALQAASFEGHQEVVKMLIRHGANVNAQGGEYGNALQAASFEGHQEVVKMLIRQGANFNAQGGTRAV